MFDGVFREKFHKIRDTSLPIYYSNMLVWSGIHTAYTFVQQFMQEIMHSEVRPPFPP
jgi:predicted MFS family arabinose efflux permease